MASFIGSVISKVFAPISGSGGGTLPILETPTGGFANAQGTEDGELKVAITEPADGLAKEAGGNLAAILAYLANLATQATLAQVAGATTPRGTNGLLTKSDATTYSPPLRWLQCTEAGVVTVVLSGSADTLAVTVAAGERVNDLIISKVMSTGTTATGISGAS